MAYIRPDGYVQIHVSGRGQLQHRYVWELYNGPIPAGFHIHHINHDKADNRIENLELWDARQHNAYHSKINKTGVKYSEESKQRMSIAAKNRKPRPLLDWVNMKCWAIGCGGKVINAKRQLCNKHHCLFKYYKKLALNAL